MKNTWATLEWLKYVAACYQIAMNKGTKPHAQKKLPTTVPGCSILYIERINGKNRQKLCNKNKYILERFGRNLMRILSNGVFQHVNSF